MAITVTRIELWNVVVDNKPGALAHVLDPLAKAGADLQVVMATSIPGPDGKACIGVFPIKGKKLIDAARSAGFEPASSMPSLLVAGDNRPGLGERMSQALAQAGIDIGVAVAQVMGTRFSALFGFSDGPTATKAISLLKKVGSTPARPAAKAAAGKTVAKPAAKTSSKKSGSAAKTRTTPRTSR